MKTDRQTDTDTDTHTHREREKERERERGGEREIHTYMYKYIYACTQAREVEPVYVPISLADILLIVFTLLGAGTLVFYAVLQWLVVRVCVCVCVCLFIYFLYIGE